MDQKVNLAEKFALVTDPYQPAIVGYINDYKLQIVKVIGPFVWHKHDETDDFFLVVSGRLTIHLRDRDIELGPGELFVRRGRAFFFKLRDWRVSALALVAVAAIWFS